MAKVVSLYSVLSRMVHIGPRVLKFLFHLDTTARDFTVYHSNREDELILEVACCITGFDWMENCF